jgi:putative ABC transport system permease protein
MRRLFRIGFTKAGIRRDLDDEIAFHLASRTDALIAQGMAPAQARERAEREYGDVDESRRELSLITRRRFSRNRREEIVTGFIEDVRYACRSFLRSPAFVAVVVGVLTIGIAATAVMFSIVDQLLLRPPPAVGSPATLHRVYFQFVRDGKSVSFSPTSFPAVVALRDRVPDLAGAAAFSRTTATLDRGADAQEVDVELVSGNYFRLLEVAPQRGRFFLPDEDVAPVGAQVAVVSDGFWRSRLGGRADVIGTQLHLYNKVFIVVGVAPRGFASLDRQNVDVWVPISTVASDMAGNEWYRNPNSFWVQIVARTRPEASLERAESEATTAYRHEQQSWDGPQDSTVTVQLGSLIGARTPDGLSVEGKVAVWLLGVAGIVLMIACANVANLLIARTIRRRREIAVRQALGASRFRLAQQFLTESAVLALLAALVAVIVARWGSRIVEQVLLPGFAWDDHLLDLRVLAFTLLSAIGVVLLVGITPALEGIHTSVSCALQGSATQISGGRRARLRQLLLALQAALSIVLLIGAGLFVRSLSNVVGRDVGVTLDRVALVSMNMKRAGFTPGEIDQTYALALQRVSHLPGVERAALVAASVPMRSGSAMGITMPDGSRPNLPGGVPFYSVAGNDFFGTIGAVVRSGRSFSDEEQRAPSRVMLINEKLARDYWPGRNPVGECVRLGSDSICTRIIGVVQNIVTFRMIDDDRAMLYLPPSHPGFGVGTHPAAMLVRTSGDPSNVVGTIRASLQGLSPRMPYVQVSPYTELVAPQLRPWRLGATMFTIFGTIALVIAAVGLYSVMAYLVSQRTHEIGVRMALGARRLDVVRLVAGQALQPIVLGMVVGVACAVWASRWIEPLLYDTSPRDPMVYAAAAIVLGAAAFVAGIVPARRSAAVDPATALRAE